MKKYAITHINRDGMRTLTSGNQGRFFKTTKAEADKQLRAFMLDNRAADREISEIYGNQAIGTFAVREVECHENGDAKGIYFDDKPEMWTFKATASLGPQYAVYSEYDHSGADIAIVYDHGNAEANARLIAAAPELLLACECAAIDCEMALSGEWDKSDEGFQATLDALTAAIHKAKGNL